MSLSALISSKKVSISLNVLIYFLYDEIYFLMTKIMPLNIQGQCSMLIVTKQLIYTTNQLTDFYIYGTLTLNG